MTIKTASVDLGGESLFDNQIPLSDPYVLISVSDTGTGIKKKDLDRVFEPFFTTKGVAEGTGMGLSMVYGFVKQSGGHVTIDSKRGKGTTINLYFPATDSLDAETVEIATIPIAEAKGTETILVVEDDEGVRQVTLEMLNELGYVVLEAEDGPSALKLLKKDGDSVDLVLSDVIMPSGMSGIDLANELRRHYQHIKMLMTSGYPDKVIDKEGNGDTEITLLRKPFKMADLAEAVRGALDR